MLANGVLDWLTRSALPGRRISHTERLAGGYRNENLLLVTGPGECFVLRRFLQANTCAVEAALADRLAGVVPVPEVVAADPTGESAGEPVLLSRFVPGIPASVAVRDTDAGQLGAAVGTVLAAIGTVTFPRPGFFSGADLDPGPEGMEPASGLAEFVERCLATGNAAQALTPAEQDALRKLAAREEPGLEVLHGARQLVHSDYNPKNLLVGRGDGGWTVRAVLDWEFAFSGSPMVDIGNMLRFHDELPPAYVNGFVAGFRAEGGDLPDDWRRLSAAVDLFALADFLTRPPDHRYFQRGVTALRKAIDHR